jgi:2-polyprenyl-6-methoxyphenol hydroxylase-like FAD-dependent oxidoreductase
MKAIIIGAGIGGLTAALMLEKQGIEAVVYERAQEIRADGAGLSIWANALRVLDELGLADTLRQISSKQGKGGLYDQHGGILTQAENDTSSIDTTLAIILHRVDLHEALLSKLKSPLKLGMELKHYEQHEGQVQLHFKDGSTDSADVLIAADGLHSKVRLQMQPQSLPVYSGYGAWRAVVEFDHAKIGDYWGESWGKGQRMGITPIGNNRIYWFATGNLPAEKRFTGAESKAYLLRQFADWYEPIPELIASTSAESILYHPIYDIEPLERWLDGHVVLLGDAAHAMTPNMGQGACQAIEDAYALAWALGNCPNIDEALRQYEALRLPRAASIMSRSRQIGKVGQLSNPLLCWLRNNAVKFLPGGMRDDALNAVIHYDIRQAIKA